MLETELKTNAAGAIAVSLVDEYRPPTVSFLFFEHRGALDSVGVLKSTYTPEVDIEMQSLRAVVIDQIETRAQLLREAEEAAKDEKVKAILEQEGLRTERLTQWDLLQGLDEIAHAEGNDLSF